MMYAAFAGAELGIVIAIAGKSPLGVRTAE